MIKSKISETASTLTLVDDVYDRMHNAIITGELEPDQQIKQVPIADSLGVSQRTIREALMRLVAEGLVRHEPRKGFRVASFPFHELEEIYQIRCLLEGFAAESAAECIQPEQIEQMRKLLPLTAATTTSRSIMETHDANVQFHMIAIHASHKPHLIRVLRQLWQLMFTQYGGEEDAKTLALVSKRELSEHKELLEALEQRNGLAARRVVEKHIEATLANLRKHWANREA